MKQIAQYQDGRIELQEVPRPQPPPNGVLVRVTHSVISIGTEKAAVEQAKMSLLQRARARPDQVRKVLDTARASGWKAAMEKVKTKLGTPAPLGYSAAGVVEAVGPHHGRFAVGDRVACGGAECAHHAEYIAVPDLLAAPVPEGVTNDWAAYTTLASIALQGVRQAGVELGQRVVVMGQGLVGLLVTNLLAASGARVLAVDLLPARRALSLQLGAERVVIPGEQDLELEVAEWTGGHGVDTTLICTATASNEPIEQAARMARDRGRIVVVGVTRMELPRAPFYDKELDLRFSRSYGPGRYDPAYEWGGHDYPMGYVRWTEQRNFQACLELMRRGQLRVDRLTTRRVPFSGAVQVYEDLAAGRLHEVGVVLDYAAAETVAPPVMLESAPPPSASARVAAPVSQVDVIGAGAFARAMLLPHLKGRLTLGTVVNQTALSATHVQRTFGFARAETDSAAVLAGGDAAVLIATRHHLHASLVCRALAAGRHVFVEKPLCLNLEELAEIDRALAASRGSVQVGFNRRFAPLVVQLRAALAAAPGPRSIAYHVVPGRLDPNSWYANEEESGGRIVGECCHFFDLMIHLAGSVPRRITAQSIGPVSGRRAFPDSLAAQVEFADGSSGQLIYNGEACPRYPKETLTVFAAGLVGRINNFQSLDLFTAAGEKQTAGTSKGHPEQMAAWCEFLAGRADQPSPYAESRRSTLLTLAALRSIHERGPVQLGEG